AATDLPLLQRTLPNVYYGGKVSSHKDLCWSDPDTADPDTAGPGYGRKTWIACYIMAIRRKIFGRAILICSRQWGCGECPRIRVIGLVRRNKE
ncbi:MAG: hypothetical protein ACLFWL_15265, partial [Candidatus Brocadiia bacterium]